MRAAVVSITIAAFALLAGCTGETDPATSITGTTAVLHGKVSCKGGESNWLTWRWHSMTGNPTADNWRYQSDILTCPAGGLTNQPISRKVSGLSPGTHYSYSLCTKVNGQTLCTGPNGSGAYRSADYGIGEDFYTTGPLAPDAGVPDPVEYAKRGLTLNEGLITGSLKPAPGLCCASGYLAPAAPDLTTDSLYGAKAYWGSSCDPAKVQVSWINEPTIAWQGLSVINGCFVNDAQACQGSCARIWLNCWNQTTHTCDLRLPPWSFNKSWCNVITHEFGHVTGLYHSTDPHSLMYPILVAYQQYNPNGAWNCASK